MSHQTPTHLTSFNCREPPRYFNDRVDQEFLLNALLLCALMKLLFHLLHLFNCNCGVRGRFICHFKINQCFWCWVHLRCVSLVSLWVSVWERHMKPVCTCRFCRWQRDQYWVQQWWTRSKTRSHSNQLTLKSTCAIFNYMVTFERKIWLNWTENFFSAVVLKVWRHAFLINCWWSRFSFHCFSLSCMALSRKSIGKNVYLKKKTVNNIRPRKQWVLVKNTFLDKRGDVSMLCFSTLQCAGKCFRYWFIRLSVYLRRIQPPLYIVDNKIVAFILVPFVNQIPK